MPPHEAYHASLSPRHADSDTELLISLFFLIAALIAIAILSFFALSYRSDLKKADSEKKEIFNSLILTKQELSKAISFQKKQRRDLWRLHKIGSRYVVEHGPLPSAVLEQIAAETEQMPEDGDWELGGSPSTGEDVVSSLSSDGERENETRVRQSVVSNASTVETDPAAPRIATTGFVRTAARLPREGGRPGDETAA
ncbi:hypothetical protein LZ32DRAFT_616129 [Colletotrichum eremochloae]|nr:hypothetical protein LZ32DRAFT_616129 [Colletotrichum eremochloae]